MNRRQVVALLSTAAVPITGCLDATGTEPTDTPATTSEQTEESRTPWPGIDVALGERYESETGPTVRVDGVRVRKLVRSTSVGSSTHIDVACLADGQFVVAEADATDADGNSILSEVRFVLEVDSTRYPREDQHWYWAFPAGSYTRPGLPAFPAPIDDATDAAVVWVRESAPPVRWVLPAETVELLGRAPSFSVRSFEVPQSVSHGASFEAAFTVANTGDRAGTFLTELGAGPISDHDEVRIDVPPDTENTFTEQLTPHYPDDATEITATLDWGCDRMTRRISVSD